MFKTFLGEAMTSTLSNQQIKKIGNSIIYLSQGVNELSKTKILKLLFLLEEASIKKYGYPFFGVDFQLWVRGPVLNDVFIDLSDEKPTMLKEYIKKSEFDDRLFIANGDFCDDEFSDNDIAVMDIIIKFARHKNASDFVDFTHGDISLWKKSAIKYGVLEELEEEKIKSTNYNIDFSLLFEDNPFLKDKYDNSIENLEFIKHLKK